MSQVPRLIYYKGGVTVSNTSEICNLQKALQKAEKVRRCAFNAFYWAEVRYQRACRRKNVSSSRIALRLQRYNEAEASWKESIQAVIDIREKLKEAETALLDKHE